MPQVLMKTGEMREIPDHELLNFLQENLLCERRSNSTQII